MMGRSSCHHDVGCDGSLESVFKRIWVMNHGLRPNFGRKFRLPLTKMYDGEELPWSTAVGRPPWFVQTLLTRGEDLSYWFLC